MRLVQVYKEYRFEIGPEMCARIVDQRALAKTAAESAQLPIDWEAVRATVDQAEAKAKAADWDGAFQAHCLALQIIGTPLNKSHHKDEAFKPNWTTPNRSA